MGISRTPSEFKLTPGLLYNISRELAKRTYNLVKSGNKPISFKIKIHLGVLAIQRIDSDMIHILTNDMTKYNRGCYYNGIYNFYPVVEVLQNINFEPVYISLNNLMLNLVLSAISSVTGMSPYEHITYKILGIF